MLTPFGFFYPPKLLVLVRFTQFRRATHCQLYRPPTLYQLNYDPQLKNAFQPLLDLIPNVNIQNNDEIQSIIKCASIYLTTHQLTSDSKSILTKYSREDLQFLSKNPRRASISLNQDTPLQVIAQEISEFFVNRGTSFISVLMSFQIDFSNKFPFRFSKGSNHQLVKWYTTTMYKCAISRMLPTLCLNISQLSYYLIVLVFGRLRAIDHSLSPHLFAPPGNYGSLATIYKDRYRKSVSIGSSFIVVAQGIRQVRCSILII